MEKKITSIETTDDGSGYVIFFNDRSKVYVRKHNGRLRTYNPAISQSNIRIIYNGKRYEA